VELLRPTDLSSYDITMATAGNLLFLVVCICKCINVFVTLFVSKITRTQIQLSL